jgi:hypothetical protein
VRIPLQHLHNPGLSPPAAVDAAYAHHDAIIVHERTHFLGREKKIIAALVGPKKAEPIGMADDPPNDEIFVVYDAVIIAAVSQYLPIPLHGIEAATERFNVLILLYAQYAGNVLDS